MPSNAALVITSLSSGGFAILGASANNWFASRRDRRSGREATALEIADVEKLVWGDSWVELESALQRHEARLAIAAVPEDLVAALHEVSSACFRYRRRSLELSDGEDGGIATDLLTAHRILHRAIRQELLRQGPIAERRKSSESAVDEAARALAEHSEIH